MHHHCLVLLSFPSSPPRLLLSPDSASTMLLLAHSSRVIIHCCRSSARAETLKDGLSAGWRRRLLRLLCVSVGWESHDLSRVIGLRVGERKWSDASSIYLTVLGLGEGCSRSKDNDSLSAGEKAQKEHLTRATTCNCE